MQPIVTHPDDDHIGGFVHMLEDLQAGKLYDICFNYFWVNDPTKHEFVPDDVQRIQTQKSLDAKLKCVYNYKESVCPKYPFYHFGNMDIWHFGYLIPLFPPIFPYCHRGNLDFWIFQHLF